MMTDRIRDIATQKPFRPFQVTLKSGESLRISRPRRAVVFELMAFFGVASDPNATEKMRIVNVNDIVSVELLQSA